MLKFLLDRLGIGGTKVDAILHEDHVSAGGILTGRVDVVGGRDKQEIHGIDLELLSKVRLVEDDTVTVAEAPLADVRLDPGDVSAGNEGSFPFSIDVPRHAPLSIHGVSTWLRTRPHATRSVEPRDTETVTIVPDEMMSAVLAAMETLGFRLAEANVEHQPHRCLPFVQELDFHPDHSRLRVNEVEMSFRPQNDELEVLLTVDRKGSLLNDEPKHFSRFRIDREGYRSMDMVQKLREIIRQLA